MVVRDGKIWWWCSKHMLPNRYNDLYVPHISVDYDEWVQKKEACKAKFGNQNKHQKSNETLKQGSMNV